jgi:hypothetical protein
VPREVYEWIETDSGDDLSPEAEDHTRRTRRSSNRYSAQLGDIAAFAKGQERLYSECVGDISLLYVSFLRDIR